MFENIDDGMSDTNPVEDGAGRHDCEGHGGRGSHVAPNAKDMREDSWYIRVYFSSLDSLFFLDNTDPRICKL